MDLPPSAYLSILFQGINQGKSFLVEQVLGYFTGPDLDNLENENQHTALVQAATLGRMSIVKMLIEAGASPNKVDSSGDCALHNALWSDEIEISQYLMENGADPDILGAMEDTPTWQQLSEQGLDLVLEFRRNKRAEDLRNSLTQVARKSYTGPDRPKASRSKI